MPAPLIPFRSGTSGANEGTRAEVMISAIVLATGDPPERARELTVRSLAWLVSAVVAGVVRDVTAACPRDWRVEDVMEHAGCALVRADGEAERLAAAAALAKCERILVLRLGFQPEGPLVAEIDAAQPRLGPEAPALLLEAPATALQRLFPDRAPVAGLLLHREQLSAQPSFRTLARTARRGLRLRTRMVPVL